MGVLLRNLFAVIIGMVIGSAINIAIIYLGNFLIPLPPGIDPTDIGSLKMNIKKLPIFHFIPPLLAHAFGTLSGAFITAKTAARQQFTWSLFIGIFFLASGIFTVFQIGGPTWFVSLDLLLAYLPMAWWGWYLAQKTKKD